MDIRKMMTARTPGWYDLIDGEETAEIRIDGIVGESWEGDGTNARRFIEQLNAIRAPHINVRINSPGGAVFDGLAIYNALHALGRKITVTVDGIAASIAAVIAMAGDEIVMPANSYLMVHRPWTIAAGNSDELIAEAGTLEDLTKTITGIFADRSGQTEDKIRDLLIGAPGSDGTFIPADEALRLHLATEVTPNKTGAADCAALDVYDLIPSGIRARAEVKPAAAVPAPPQEDNPESFREVFAQFHINTTQEVNHD